jgi:2-keto-myo-inositol isomerase
VEDGDRVLPGKGVIRLSELIAQLRERHYDGPFSVETFNPAYWTEDPMEIAQAAHAAAARLLG